MSDISQIDQVGIGEPIGLTPRLDGVVIGALVGFAEGGMPIVDYPGNPKDNPVLARTVAVLRREDVGHEVALLFEGADPAKPILIGPVVSHQLQAAGGVSADRDGERLEFTADREIVLRCGKASITLTRAGKVLIRGAYVSSHSSGVNKIKGGAIHIN